MRMQFYTTVELVQILNRQADKLEMNLAEDGAEEVAKRSRGTPRVAGRLLRRVRDIALVDGAEFVTAAIADKALSQLGVDKKGLDGMDRRYLSSLADLYGGGPVGVDTGSCSGRTARYVGRGDRALSDADRPFDAHTAWRCLSLSGWAI